MDIAKLNDDELRALADNAANELKERGAKQRNEKIKTLKALIAELSLSDKELKSLLKGNNTKAAKLAKYKNPNDESQTWSGAGRKPKWFIDCQDQGVSLKDLEI